LQTHLKAAPADALTKAFKRASKKLLHLDLDKVWIIFQLELD
jgi:hypothetical protein